MKNFLLSLSILIFLPFQSGSSQNKEPGEAKDGKGERALEEVRNLSEIQHRMEYLRAEEGLLQSLRADLDSVRAMPPN